MRLLSRLTGAAPEPARPAPPAALDVKVRYGRPPVSWSADLARVVSLPRRDLETAHTDADVAALEARLRRPDPKCVCTKFGRDCPLHLRKPQAHSLLEAPLAGGLIAALGVGHGKTLIDLLLPMVIPGCKVAVLLIPANLRAQLFERDWPYYGGHWQLPNLAGGQWFTAGRPVLHVVTYNILSRPESSDLLKRIKPDAIICDEAHNLKAPDSARTRRFIRYFQEFPETKLYILSGTVASRSIKDYAHLAALTLGDSSPLPHHKPVIEEWSTALDPAEVIAPPGALEKLCLPGEDVRDGFRRRRNDTLGVVSTREASVGCSLVIRKRDPGDVPDDLLGKIEQAHAGVRPDGEEFVEQLQISMCARQLSAGFYHRWRYPRGEPLDLIEKWFGRRQEFNREMREKLKRPLEHLDSPGLLVHAAVRAHQQPPYEGDKPIWRSRSWPEWSEVMNDVQPVTEAVWESDFVIRDAAAWARENVGIVWVEFPELGEKIARAADVPWYGGGPDASDLILREKGDRSVVASIKAHGTGKNLQQWCRNLVVTPPADGATWEQLIGRTHRDGQKADEVTVDVMLHTDDYRESFKKAREFARFIQQTDGAAQRLMLASYEWAD